MLDNYFSIPADAIRLVRQPLTNDTVSSAIWTIKDANGTPVDTYTPNNVGGYSQILVDGSKLTPGIVYNGHVVITGASGQKYPADFTVNCPIG